ncbi:alpha/beta hydrolase [Chryseobacterium taklimakanense]|uniref:Alpha/beta fold hydrolase n=1 Tax=Chryseobacterium taklimakanense TaxID=536441 RepID=A0A3G8WHY7_9FLAO|nr:alpha/beta fold hydrolase [Chryseobacterium taklimakanense]AZI20159.1 alpha/beta fold hydrolase [Chryseobacterium taklimakanense]
MSKIFQYLQEKVVFLPVKLPEDFEYSFDCAFEEYFFDTPNEGKINAVHFKIQKPKGVILYFHGNSDNLVRWGKIASELTGFGYDVFVPDYRHYGKSTGPRNEEYLFSDAQFCYDFLKKQYGEENITVYGRSLGGAFAVKMAADNEPKKLILEATFFNLQDIVNRWLPNSATEKISPKMTYHFHSNKNILEVNCPLYHFHGDKDFVVPINSGKKLFETLHTEKPELEKKFIEIKGGSHDDLSKFEEFQNELNRIL